MLPTPKESTQDGIQNETRMASFSFDQEQNSRDDVQQCRQERTSSEGFFETKLQMSASTVAKMQQRARPEACRSSAMLIAVVQIVAALVLLALALCILLSFRLRLRVPLVV